MAEIAEALAAHLIAMTHDRSAEEQAAARSIDANAILSHIHYYRVHDYVEQIALVNVLPALLDTNPQVS